MQGSEVVSSAMRRLALAAVAILIAACGGGGSEPEITEEDLERLRPSLANARIFCPRVSIRRESQGFPVFAQGDDGDPELLIYQGTISDTARECNYVGDQLTMRVGVSGRVLRGPVGRGAISAVLPIRVAVTDGGNQAIYNEVSTIPVSVGEGMAASGFAHVRENVIVIRRPEDNWRDFVVLVGFDVRNDDF